MDNKGNEMFSSANIDYLTLIYKDEETRKEIYSLIADYHREQVLLGNELRYYRLAKYVGLKIGQMAEASHGENSLLCVWGETSQRYKYLLENSCVRPTRVDLAVTVRLRTSKPYLVRNTLKRHEKGLVTPKYKAHLRSINNLGGGDTLYCGNRSKKLLLRLYDKGIERGDGIHEKGTLWRYEVEFKRENAQRARDSLVKNNFSHEYIRGLVARLFDERGIPILYNINGGNYRLESAVKMSDTERKLKWLNQTVSPVLKQLKLKGLFDEVEEALNLSDYYKL